MIAAYARALKCQQWNFNSMSNISNPLSPLPFYPGTRPRFHAMVKPTGAVCNLDCTYCYYLHKEQLLGSRVSSGSATRF